MTAPLTRPFVKLPLCGPGREHDWSVSMWVDIPEDGDGPIQRRRMAVEFYCAHCLATVESATIYAEQPEPEAVEAPDGDPRLHLARLNDLLNETAMAAAAECDTPAGEDASQKQAALEWAIAALKPVAV